MENCYIFCFILFSIQFLEPCLKHMYKERYNYLLKLNTITGMRV